MTNETPEAKLIQLTNVLGAEKALEYAASHPDEFEPSKAATDSAAEAAAEAEAVARLTSTNPFVRGSKNFSLARQAELYSNPKTRKLAIGLAKSAGVTLKAEPTAQDLQARLY